mgnify:CR=1 FL=1
MIEKGNNIPVLIKSVPIRAALLEEAKTESAYGILMKDMYRYQEDIESKMHLVEVLVGGKIRTFWRPVVNSSREDYSLDEVGFWEECTPNGRAFSSFIIVPVNK